MSDAPAASLADTLAGAALRFGDTPAVVRWDGETLSYATWWGQACALAGWMARRGVGEGDRVALVLPSGLEYLVAAAAASALGAIVAGVNPSLAPNERAGLVELVDPKLVLADPALTEGLDPARRVEATTACEPGRAPWAELLSTEPDRRVDRRCCAASSDRSASLVFTSGTTGLPKAAKFTEGALAAIARLDLGAAPPVGAGALRCSCPPSSPTSG
jgi:acyl-CoA synthetase (AMP-forming)/AMP-acid ligase II